MVKLHSETSAVISWRKNKSILSIEGESANNLKKKICGYICEYSTDLPDNLADVEELKQGQLVNTEAIRSLSDSIIHLTADMRNFQDFIANNREFLSQNKMGNITDPPNQYSEYENQVHVCDDNVKEISKPIVIEQSTICIGDTMVVGAPTNDRQTSFLNANEDEFNEPINSENLLSLLEVEDEGPKHPDVANNPTAFTEAATSVEFFDHDHVDNQETINKQASYAEVVASSLTSNNTRNVREKSPGNPFRNNSYIQAASLTSNNTCNALGKSPCNVLQNNSQQRSIDPSSDPADGFVGVDRKRSKVKKFLLSGIADNVKECQVLSYLKQRNVSPTFISVFPSKRKGTISAKIHFRPIDCTLVQQQNSWPDFVNCKPWQPKGKTREVNITHSVNGKFSTYV